MHNFPWENHSDSNQVEKYQRRKLMGNHRPGLLWPYNEWLVNLNICTTWTSGILANRKFYRAKEMTTSLLPAVSEGGRTDVLVIRGSGAHQLSSGMQFQFQVKHSPATLPLLASSLQAPRPYFFLNEINNALIKFLSSRHWNKRRGKKSQNCVWQCI